MRIIVSIFNVNVVLIILFFLQCFDCATTSYPETEVNKTQVALEGKKNVTKIKNPGYNFTSEMRLKIDDQLLPKIRTKRQSGAGKFSDSAKMSQTKVLQLWLQMVANMVSPVYVGGSHPFHKDVPKPVVIMLKRRIGEVLFPKLDADKKSEK